MVKRRKAGLELVCLCDEGCSVCAPFIGGSGEDEIQGPYDDGGNTSTFTTKSKAMKSWDN